MTLPSPDRKEGPEPARMSSLAKALGLLRLVGERKAAGANLTQLARRAGLNTATAHRLLSVLVAEGFLSFDPYSKLYHLGVGLYALVGNEAEAGTHGDLRGRLRGAMERIARETEDSVYLSVISRGEALCIDKVPGAFPVSVNTLDIGARRPLGAGGGSMALLCALPAEEQARIIASNQERYERYGKLNAATVEAGIRFHRRYAYAFNDAIILPEIGAIAVPVFHQDSSLAAAISLAAIRSRLKPARRLELVAVIRRAIEAAGFRTFEEPGAPCIR